LKTLKNEGRHLAKSVLIDSPAYRAGLREGDFVISINNELVDGVDRQHVIDKMLSNPKQVDILVVGDLESYLSIAKSRSPF
jgi:C-terminal processing protease CtpA/Prc